MHQLCSSPSGQKWILQIRFPFSVSMQSFSLQGWERFQLYIQSWFRAPLQINHSEEAGPLKKNAKAPFISLRKILIFHKEQFYPGFLKISPTCACSSKRGTEWSMKMMFMTDSYEKLSWSFWNTVILCAPLSWEQPAHDGMAWKKIAGMWLDKCETWHGKTWAFIIYLAQLLFLVHLTTMMEHPQSWEKHPPASVEKLNPPLHFPRLKSTV